MSDDSRDNEVLSNTLNRLSEAIERLNNLVEGLAIELATEYTEESPAEYDTEPEPPTAGRHRTLH